MLGDQFRLAQIVLVKSTLEQTGLIFVFTAGRKRLHQCDDIPTLARLDNWPQYTYPSRRQSLQEILDIGHYGAFSGY
jgi:hypothetical protein